MAFSFHAPTRSSCAICDKLEMLDSTDPIIETINGKASDANGYPFHDWYNFVLGFTPTFPEYMIKRENIGAGDIVLDPFNGSGTTQLVCKLHHIKSIGIDANDFMVYAANEKLNWTRDIEVIEPYQKIIIEKYNKLIAGINWDDSSLIIKRAELARPIMLDKRYMSDKPLIKIMMLKQVIEDLQATNDLKSFYLFALASILVPISNVKYGPGFGVGKIKDDVDVLTTYCEKTHKMISDLKTITQKQATTVSATFLGDSRNLSTYVQENSVSLIITSPPYPGDHEYTKHSRIELIFNGMATDLASFRKIKKRMLRASTTNIYKEDNDRDVIKGLQSVIDITTLINKRLQEDNATSGFEKLYTKLVWEYFGGMHKTFTECMRVLRPGGKIALLVSDSHAFKMVHIQTTQILREIGQQIGLVNPEIHLWQMKNSTSHKYKLRENILVMQKPY